MAITPSGGSGYLTRSTNTPTGAAGYTWCAWIRITGNATNFDCIWSIELDASNYLGLNVATGGTAVTVFSANGLGQAIVSPAANTWVFVCLKQTAATTIRILHRLDGDTALTDSGNLTSQEPLATWSQALLNDGAGELGAVIQLHAFKQWNAVLSDAEIWEESLRLLPRRRVDVDSFLPLYDASGTDEGGLGRNWTVTGTPALVAAQPALSRGAGVTRALLPTASAVTGTGAAQLAGLTAAASGTLAISGTGAPQLPGLTAAASGTVRVTGTGAASTAGLTASGSAAQTNAATGAAQTAGLTASGVGFVEMSGSGAATLAGLTASASGSLAVGGSGAAQLPGLQAAAASTMQLSGSGAAVLPGLVAAGTAETPPITGTGAGQLAGLTAAGTGVITVAGAGAGALAGLTASGAATVAVSGSGAASVSGLQAAAAGAQTITCTGAGVLGGLTAFGREEEPGLAESVPTRFQRMRARIRLRG